MSWRARGVVVSVHWIPRSAASDPGVDDVDVLLQLPWSTPDNTAEVRRRVSRVPELDLGGELQRRHHAAGERPNELTELARQRQEGPERRGLGPRRGR